MDTFYIIAHVTQEGCKPERASIECQDLYDSGLPVGEFLTLCGCFQNEWFLDDVRVGRSPEGQIVRYWGDLADVAKYYAPEVAPVGPAA